MKPRPKRNWQRLGWPAKTKSHQSQTPPRSPPSPRVSSRSGRSLRATRVKQTARETLSQPKSPTLRSNQKKPRVQRKVKKLQARYLTSPFSRHTRMSTKPHFSMTLWLLSLQFLSDTHQPPSQTLKKSSSHMNIPQQYLSIFIS